MLRKFALVIIAVSSLGVATLTPTPASAWRGPAWGPGWGWRRGWGWGGPRFVVAPGFYGGGCVVRRLVPGPWGPRWIFVNRCWW
ncbi:MAG: sulfur globule protein precursor [Pseudolabrys sp.]